MRVGDLVAGAVALDVFGGASPLRELRRVVGLGAECSEVGRRGGEVGVDELADAGLDGLLDDGEASQVVAVLADVLTMLLESVPCALDGVAEVFDAMLEVSDLGGEHDLAVAPFVAVP